MADAPQVGPTEPSLSGQWSVRESFLAVLISNAPMVFPLLKRWFYAASGMMSFSHYNSSGAVNYTAWGSDETIVVEGKDVGEVVKESGSLEPVQEEERRSRRGSMVGWAVNSGYGHGGILKTREWQLSEVYEHGWERYG